MTNETTNQASNGGGTPFLVQFFRILLRLLLVLIIGIGLGTLIYYGVPALYRDFIQPVQLNSERIADLEQLLESQKESFRQQVEDLESRAADAEGRLTTQNELVAELQAQREAALERLDALEEEITGIEQLQDELQDLTSDLEAIDPKLEELEAQFISKQIPLEAFKRDLELLRVMELVSHARIWLMQDNYGKAAEDLQAAEFSIEAVLAQAEQEDQEVLQNILERLGRARQDLEQAPTIVSDDLENVWELLNTLLAPAAPEPQGETEA